ncbi:DUF5357 family protein [Dapis sp. BLCC M126]|uniref:DUF5357 family protein n=1 Tax=Dapis sp. BLCC M126 TaxID=3400189 RepID=UPI003CF6CA1A
MKEIWKSLTDLFGGITGFFKDTLDFILPPKFWHWQTFLLLTIALWLLSMIISEVDSNKEEAINFISSLSWLSLTIAVGWRTNQKPFIFGEVSLSAWITGGLICFLLYENLSSNIQYVAIVSWPIISVCIAAIILVLSSPDSTTEVKVNQLSKSSFVILILVNFLVSCWLGLYFMIQGMVQQYPTMGEDDLSQSTFVYRLITPSINDYRGAKIMNLMEQKLNNDLGNQKLGLSVPKMKLRLENIKDEVTKEISVKEDDLWKLQTPIVANRSGYQLELQLFWEGPTAKDESYYLSKSCKIAEKVRQRSSGSTPQNEAVPVLVGNVECGAVEKKAVKPESQQENLKNI